MTPVERLPDDVEPDPDVTLLLHLQRVFCPAHGAHLRSTWPDGFRRAATHVLDVALHGLALVEAVRELGGEDEDRMLDASVINVVTAARPLCYFIPKDEVRVALSQSGIGHVGPCPGCGHSRLGGMYVAPLPNTGGRAKAAIRLCFGCAAEMGQQMHLAYPGGNVW